MNMKEKRDVSERVDKKKSGFIYYLGIANGIFSMLLLTVNTVFWFLPLLFFAILKLIIPLEFWRKFCSIFVDGIATIWISTNNFNIWLTKNIHWEVSGLEKLRMDEWYLVLSNHQTWVDIVVLQKIFNRKIPFLKFFLKKELIWVPLMGIAWWALDYPFMKRYSKAFIKKNPHLKGKDVEETRKACGKYKTIPVSIMNFIEGTRFSQEKHDKQKSPFKHLLKPKAGGAGYVLSIMGEQLTSIVNVTIFYPKGSRTFWEFLCGEVKEVEVKIETLPITEEILGDYTEDPEYQKRFQLWLNDLWLDKDKKLEKLKG